MDRRLELSILSESGRAAVLARCGADVAVRWVKLDQKLAGFKAFRQRLLDQLRGNAPLQKLTTKQVEEFGRDLFTFFVGVDASESVRDLYDQVKANDFVSWKIFTDNSDLSDLPWEFLQEPRTLCPNGTRCVVRILQTVGLAIPPPASRTQMTRPLLVVAEPEGLRTLGWEQIESTLQREYRAQGSPLDPEIIEGANLATLQVALQAKHFDIVHFSCHGDATGSEGRLVFVDRQTKKPDYISAAAIGRVLVGRDIRLVVLSACETALPGSQRTTFSNTAEALIRLGIPAVVANQAPIKVTAMTIFVAALYRELAKSGNIDKAMAEARLALSNALPKDDPEWGIPTLHRLYGGAQLYA
jgi:hypothetical protein